nr:hypothetical protein Itr_chr02CG11820 [Ipomoea trifida]
MSSGLRLLPLSLGAAAAESDSVINGTEPPVPSPVSRRCKATGELRGGSPSDRLQRCGLAVLSTPSNGNGDGSGSEQNGSRRWSVSLLRRSTSVKVMMCRQSNDQPTNDVTNDLLRLSLQRQCPPAFVFSLSRSVRQQQSPTASSTEQSHRCPPLFLGGARRRANSAGVLLPIDCSGVDWRCFLLRLTGMATVAEGYGGDDNSVEWSRALSLSRPRPVSRTAVGDGVFPSFDVPPA